MIAGPELKTVASLLNFTLDLYTKENVLLRIDFSVLWFRFLRPCASVGIGHEFKSESGHVTCSDNLQRLQNRAARIIIETNSSREALNNLGWSDLKTIRGRNKCVLVFKCLHNLVPKYLSEYFIRNSSFI